MEKYCLIRNVYSSLKSYVSKCQVCIYDTIGDTAVFVKVIFGFFRFCAKFSDNITLELYVTETSGLKH